MEHSCGGIAKSDGNAFGTSDSLMMSVPDPRERAQNRDDNEDVCSDTGNQNRVVSVLVVDEDQYDAED